MRKKKLLTDKTKKNLAVLALMLDTKQPIGVKPTLLEIDLWRRGKLKKKRAKEVKSFVAKDSDCYQAWVDLLESERMLANEKREVKDQANGLKKVLDWFSKVHYVLLGKGFVAATAIIFMAVVGLKTFMQAEPDVVKVDINKQLNSTSNEMLVSSMPKAVKRNDHYKLPDPPSSFGPSERIYDSADSSPFSPDAKLYSSAEQSVSEYDQIKPIILKGVRDGLLELQEAEGEAKSSSEWARVMTTYPRSFPRCPDTLSADDCRRQYALLYVFGRWLASVQLQCSLSDSTMSLLSYEEPLSDFNIIFSVYVSLSPLTEQLSDWQSSTNSEIFCLQIKHFISSIDD
ncbi:MAG: hypothetical protein methR_P2777 [Methyloprofundus sp.]|nr:MAG: hypothetical protein methR_P2777 [Methyloprofundus sp.]